jgi:hypothetical protein
MNRLVESRIMFAAVFVLFALACASNAIQGAGVALPGRMLLDGNVMIADGPILQPDPWDGSVTIADGPILQPDPWDGSLSVTA